MSWPLSHEFNEAIQNPKLAFADPDLRDGEVVVGATGLPLPRSGNFADVYQMRGADGRDWAVKCFTRPVFGLGERYAKVSEALAKANLPFAVGFKFLTEGIRVAGVWRPVVVMEWVEGMLLNQVVRDAAEKPATLTALGQMWVKLCKRLREAGLAHADLQHGNVLMVPGTRAGAYGLKLIDYDGVWVPALANTPSGESGHSSFQHPARAATRNYSPDVDRFPHLVVATALRGLAVGGAALWEKYDNGDNLLFTEDDYKKPSASKAMRELWELEHPAVQALVGRLAIACGKPIPQTPWLDQFAPDGEPTLLDNATRREAAAALGVALPVPVALPPEPLPLPLPAPAPVRATAPANPFTVVNDVEEDEEEEDEVDVELVEARSPKAKKAKPAAKAKRGAKAQRRKQPGANRPLIAGAGFGALLLVGLAAAVFLSRGEKPKPDDTAQKKDDPAPVAPKPAPKDNNPAVATPKKEPDNTPPLVPGTLTATKRWAQPLPDGWKRAVELRIAADSRTGQVAGGDGKLVVFDTGTGAALTNPPDAASIQHGVLVLNDARVATNWQVFGGPLQVWSARDGKEAAALARVVPGPVHVVLSPNGRYMSATPGHGQGKVPLKLTDTTTGKILVDTTWSRGSVWFTADSSRALVADGAGLCQWIKLPSGASDGEGKIGDGTGRVHILSLSGDGSRLVADIARVGRRLVNARTGELLRPLKGAYNEAALSQDGKLLLRSEWPDRGLTLLNAGTDAELLRLELPQGVEVSGTGLAPDGSAIFVAAPAGAGRFELIRYDIARGGAAPPPVSPDPGPGPVAAAAVKERFQKQLDFLTQNVEFSADGRTILAHASNQPGLGIVDAQTGAVRTVTTSGPLRSHNVFPLPGGRAGLRITETQVITVVSTETGKTTGTAPFPPFTLNTPNVPTVIRVSPDERYVAAGLSNPSRLDPDTKKVVHTPTAVRVLDTRTNRTVVSFDWHNVGYRGRIAFSADSSRVLVVESTLRGRWFKLPSGEPDDTWQYADAAAAPERFHVHDVSRDARVVLCDGTVDGLPRVFILDAATGKRTATFAQALGGGSGIGLSADGRRALFFHLKQGARDRDFVIADTTTGTEIARVPLPLEPETDLQGALSPDGRALVVYDRRKPAPLVVYDIPAGPGGGAAVAPPPPALTPPAAPLEMKAKWSVATKTQSGNAPAFTGDGERIVLADRGALPWRIVSFDARTGAAGPELSKLGGNPTQPFAANGPAIGYQSEHGREIVVWDVKAEKTTPHAYRQPPGTAGTTPSAYISPNGRYLALGHADGGPDARKERPLTPLEVLDTTTGQVLFKTDWRVGRALFTADSARLLVVDADDRFRWFRLPDGKAEGEWEFKRPAFGFNARVFGVSTDGRVIGYLGQPPGKGDTVHLLDGTTGAVLHSFPAKRYAFALSVSPDGRFVALIRNDGFGPAHSIEIADVKGNVFAVLKFPQKANASTAVHWKTRTVALHNRTAGELVAYELPFDPNAGAQPLPPAGAIGDALEPNAPGEPPALAAKRETKVGAGKTFDRLVFAPDANAVLLGSASGFEVSDPKSGTTRNIILTTLNTPGVADLFALADGRLGTVAPKATEVRVWNGKTGRLADKYNIPDLAPGAGDASALTAVPTPNE